MSRTAKRHLGPRFSRALAFATRVHRGDTRKGKTTPYIGHLLGVCALVLQDGGNEDEAIAALLHDTLEDHPEEVTAEELEKRFGARVRRIVQSCTDTPAGYRGGPKPPWRHRKEAYLRHLAGASKSVRRVALADKLFNLSEVLGDLRLHGAGTWARFNAGSKDQLWYYEQVLKVLRRAGHVGAMLEEYRRTLADLRALVRQPAARSQSAGSRTHRSKRRR